MGFDNDHLGTFDAVRGAVHPITVILTPNDKYFSSAYNEDQSLPSEPFPGLTLPGARRRCRFGFEATAIWRMLVNRPGWREIRLRFGDARWQILGALRSWPSRS